jgi:enamine deaminase RidA (YjgF/YER057c/UK114 family)
MTSTVEQRLAEAGLTLPPAPTFPPEQATPIADLIVDGNHVYLSGAGPFEGERLVYKGKLGADLDVDDGYAAARLTLLNHLRTLVDEGIDLDRLRWLKVLGMVNSAADFDRQPSVVNGYSDLLIELFGRERGLHARSAIGFVALPMNMAIEVEAICVLE